MKVGAKSSLEQVMKYGLLHHKEYETSWIKKKYHLIYLGKGDFSSLWKEKFNWVSELKEAFAKYQIPEVSKKWWIPLAEYEDAIKSMVAEMTISYINYNDVKDFCATHLPHVTHSRQIYKLLQWMILELEDRELAS
jgi:hypothetical protein